jgi:hypothetical protein
MNTEHQKAALAKLLGIIEAGPVRGPPLHVEAPDCRRCRRDDPNLLEVPKAESRVFNGRVYYLATCRDCTDLEFSERWQKRFLKATTDEQKRALEDEADAWTRSGRRYVGTGRPGAPAPKSTTPHVDGCRCSECRARAVAAVQEETSLLPAGYAP